MPSGDTSKKFDSVAIYRIRKLLSDLSNKSGRGTELVSLYLPPKKAVHEAIAALREESGTASNIKSDTTRNHVQEALTKTMARLRLYKQTPESGIVIFCGAIPGPGGPGNETIELYEVLPQKPVTTYLYRCVSPDTLILMDDGMLSPIQDLEGSWRDKSVSSFDPTVSRVSTARIKHHMKSGSDGRHVYQFTVESGRGITATEDHPFFTPKGWVSAGKLGVGDLVAVLPVDDLLPDASKAKPIEGGTIIDEESIVAVDAPPANLRLTIRRLKARGLLPLRASSKVLPLLARLLGHLFSDGSLTRNVELRNGKPYIHYTVDLCVGSDEDIEALRNDLAKLRVKLPPSLTSTHVMHFSDRDYVTKTVHAKLRDTAIVTLLRALGAPVGSKVKNGTRLPGWLTAAPLPVQKEFLAAYMGGDGEAPRIIKSNLASAVRLTFHRSNLILDGALSFARDLERMFLNFGVVTNAIEQRPSGYVRKDGIATSEIELRFALTEKNVLKLSHSIGYRYCKRKSSAANLVGEYLRIKSTLRSKSLTKMRKLREMTSSGASLASASKTLNVSEFTARQWIKSTSVSPLIRAAQLPPFAEWRGLSKKRLGDSLLWESVVTKEDVELATVMDLTVDSQYHTFFANGFLVHNCDDHFHLDPLRDMLREQNVIGVLAMDATEAGLGIVTGDTWEVVDVLSSGVSGKTRKGGQSARRYERLRDMELTEYYTRVADHAKKAFLESYQIKGLIVSGPGPTKDEFVKDRYLDYRLQNVIVGTIDSGYVGREGVRETIEKSGKLLENVRVVEERKLVQRFLREVNSDSGLAIYGIQDVLSALKKAAVDTILINEDVDTVYLKSECRKCGNVVEKFVPRSQIVAEKQKLLVCPNCGSNEVDIMERDVVDYLADASIDSGANVEVISSRTEDGAMMKNFGGISAILRYRA